MDARLVYWQLGDLMLLLLGDYAGENGRDAFWRAKDILDKCVLIRSAIQGKAEGGGWR